MVQHLEKGRFYYQNDAESFLVRALNQLWSYEIFRKLEK